MSTPIEFRLLPLWDGNVRVEWTADLRGADFQYFLKALAAAIDPIDGVESIHVGRYSLIVQVAYHVLAAGGHDEEDMANEIAFRLDEDPEVLHQLRIALREPTAEMHLEVVEE